MITKEKVLASIKWAKENGWKIDTGRFYSEADKCCCIVGAIGLHYQSEHPEEVSVLYGAAKALETTYEEVWHLIYGFDNRIVREGSDAGRLGLELKEMWVSGKL